MSGVNSISVVVPATSAQAQAERDEAVSKILAALGSPAGDFYHYVDSSPLGMWAYLFITYVYSSTPGIMTIATVSCSGMAHPPSGSDLLATTDPGAGNYVWGAVGALPTIQTSSGNGGGGRSVPSGNNNYYVWKIPGNSSAAATDFTTAITVVEAALASSLLGGAIQKKYLKYVDSVSSAWQVSAIYFGGGCAEFGTTSTVSVLPNNNILYAVTCSGSPNPPTGSAFPAVTLPSFTQTFTTITGPLSFGPQR